MPGFEAASWQGFGVPKGTPAEIVEKLSRAINTALADTTVRARIEATGYSPFATSPAEFRQHIADETAKWEKVIRAANLRLN